MGRIIAGIVAGLVTVLLVVGMVELAAHALFPLPAEGAPIPLAVLLLVLAAYFAGALLGGLVAARISRRAWTPWLIAALVAAGAIWSMFVVPHPRWMEVAAVIVPFLGAVAARHAPRRKEPA
jgi:hypothetical protein